MNTSQRGIRIAAMTLFCVFTTLASANRIRSALERYERSQLKVAMISEPRLDGSRWAYIEDPGGYWHRVDAGDYIGRRDGKIQEIRAKDIVISEIYKKGNDYVEETVTMRCERALSCNEVKSPPVPTTCKASKDPDSLSQPCAIFFARREIAKRGEKVDELEFDTRYDSTLKTWIVVAVQRRAELVVTSDGKVRDYEAKP